MSILKTCSQGKINPVTNADLSDIRGSLEKLAELNNASANETTVFYIAEPRAYELLFRHEKIEKLFDVRHLSDIPNQAAEPFGITISYKGNMIQFEQFENSFIKSDILLGIMSAKDICNNVKAAMKILRKGQRIFALAPYSFLESEQRAKFFKEYPIQKMLISPSRYKIAKNGNFDYATNYLMPSRSNINYAWYIWEQGWSGKTVIEWFDYDDQEIYDRETKHARQKEINCNLSYSAKKLLRDYL